MTDSVFSAVTSNLINFLLVAALSYLWRKYKDAKAARDVEQKLREQELAALRAGMQAVLRDKMIDAYNKFYEKKGYMPIYARESFIATYNAYHNLGENGVMDGIKNKVLTLPTTPEDED